jgi:glycosyltransferase involved in cell wall biosynthesis
MSSASDGVLPHCILSAYPLTSEFKARIADVVGAGALWLTVSELRQEAVSAMVRYLRSLKVDSVFLPIENEDGTALLPVLKIVASVIPSRGIFVLGSGLQPTPVKRHDVAISSFHLVRASLQAIRKKHRAARDVAVLLSAERIAVRQARERQVLYLNANLWFGVNVGGSVGHISGVVNGFLDEGYPVEFVSAGGRLLMREEALHTQLAPPSHFGTPWEYNFYRFHYDVIDQVRKLAAVRKFGLIYQRLSVCNFSGVALSRLLGMPLVLEYNGSEVWAAKNWGKPLHEQRLAEQVEEVNLRHSHMVVTISDVLRDELLNRGIPEKRIVNYPNCIDPETFDPGRFSADAIASLRRRYGIASDAIVTTFVGTFGQWHGAIVLADAVRQLLDWHGRWVADNKLHFLFVGDGLRMPEVRKALGNHAQGPYVTLAGLVPQHEAPLYLAASDILVSPHVPNADGSRFFGSPTKLFEYMAMGKAILASDLDQIGEVLSGGIRVEALESGDAIGDHMSPALLARPGDPKQIVDGLKFLVENPDRRHALGANARWLALERYTWRHHVRSILDGAQGLGLILAADQQQS